jgi:hypothetical protein
MSKSHSLLLSEKKEREGRRGMSANSFQDPKVRGLSNISRMTEDAPSVGVLTVRRYIYK